MQDFLLNDVGLSYLILGRFLQDCLENLFSLIRFRQAIPTALLFKQNLKVITLAQLCLTSNNTSYFVDCPESEVRKLETDFLDLCQKISAAKKSECDVLSLMEESAIRVPQVEDHHLSLIDPWECAVLYDMAGAVIISLKKLKLKLCDLCLNAVLWKGEGHHALAIVVQLRNYKENCLVEVSDECFRAILKTEITFREMRDVLRNVEHVHVLNFLVSNLMYVWDGSKVPTCHNITRKILQRYLTMRFRVYGLQRKQELSLDGRKEYNSKSMAMHAAVA